MRRGISPSGRGWLAILLLTATACHEPHPFVVTDLYLDPLARPFLAGVGEVEFTPGPGYPLGGYGGGARRADWPFYMGLGWPGRWFLERRQARSERDGIRADMLVPAEGVHDAVTARALVFRTVDEAGPAPPRCLAVVRIDAIATTADLHDLVVSKVADLGFGPAEVLLVANHTHSGPGGYMRAPLARIFGTDNFMPEIEEKMAEACAEAIRRGLRDARPAAMGFARAFDRDEHGKPVIARNRRARRFDPGVVDVDDLDLEIGLWWIEESRPDGEPIALVVNYAVHPTVLGSDNLLFGGDLAAGIESAVSRCARGAPVLFVNGALGDVGPRSLSDAEGFARCQELGEALAGLIEPALRDVELHDRATFSTAIGNQELGSPRTLLAAGRERFLDGEGGPFHWFAVPFTLPFNLLIWILGFTNCRFEATWSGSAAVVVNLEDYLDRTHCRIGALRIQAGDQDVFALGIPGEATHDLGLRLREEASRHGATQSFLFGLCFDHIGYIASRTEYRRGAYEAWMTLFGEETAERVFEGMGAVLELLKPLVAEEKN